VADETGTRTSRRIERLRERRERHKQRHKLYRFGVGLLGGFLILAGLALSLPGVPGPGLVVVAIGLGLLALEFDRAERLLERILERIEDATEGAKPWQKALVAALVVVGAVGSIVLVVFWDVPLIPG
jgi:uncharacterized protein (TIGR02611 family)